MKIDFAAQMSPEEGLADRVHGAVFKLITSQQLQGGDIIVESRLAELLGVSRTPLREALQRLEGQGLVTKTGRSFVVRLVDLAEYLQSLKVRELLEGEAAALSVGRVPKPEIARVRANIDGLLAAEEYTPEAHWQSDDEVHGLIHEHCGNPVLSRMVRELRMVMRLYETKNLTDRLLPDATEHLEIIEALEGRDAELAREKLRKHMRSLFFTSI